MGSGYPRHLDRCWKFAKNGGHGVIMFSWIRGKSATINKPKNVRPDKTATAGRNFACTSLFLLILFIYVNTNDISLAYDFGVGHCFNVLKNMTHSFLQYFQNLEPKIHEINYIKSLEMSNSKSKHPTKNGMFDYFLTFYFLIMQTQILFRWHRRSTFDFLSIFVGHDPEHNRVQLLLPVGPALPHLHGRPLLPPQVQRPSSYSLDSLLKEINAIWWCYSIVSEIYYGTDRVFPKSSINYPLPKYFSRCSEFR